MFHTPDSVRSPLYVVTPMFNPVRYKSRWKLFQRFAKSVVDQGGVLVTVEAAFGHRAHALEGQGPAIPQRAPCDPPHQSIQVRTSTELWIKENLINIGISRLPSDWEYVAWVDADVMFARPNWVGETIHQLQHYQVVQMFSDAMDLGPDYAPQGRHRGYVQCWREGFPVRHARVGYDGGDTGHGGSTGHTGFAWAARRSAIDCVGGLIDWAILGAADRHMAQALVGQVRDFPVSRKIHRAYMRRLIDWQERAEHGIRRNVGVVSGLLLHYHHGPKRLRQYRDRWNILTRHRYNPDTDIKFDAQGVLQLRDRSGEPRLLRLRDEIRDYFRQRDEDSREV